MADGLYKLLDYYTVYVVEQSPDGFWRPPPPPPFPGWGQRPPTSVPGLSGGETRLQSAPYSGTATSPTTGHRNRSSGPTDLDRALAFMHLHGLSGAQL